MKNTLPLRPYDGCYEGTIDNGFTCFCENHCSWEICRLNVPPSECLPTNNTKWVWNSEKLHWSLQGNKFGQKEYLFSKSFYDIAKLKFLSLIFWFNFL